MAEDFRLGGAWVDVSLKLGAEFEKGIRDVQKRLKAVSSKTGEVSIASEKKHLADLSAGNKMFESRQKLVLGITDEMRTQVHLMDKQVADAVKLTQMQKGGMFSRLTGLSGNKAGMFAAQGSYALQDFLTGVSMGNMTQALLGASNNLSMMAMAFGGLGGIITSVAVSALPLLATAIKALNNEEVAAKAAVEALTKAFERQQFAIRMNAIARDKLTPAEVARMHGAAGIAGRILGEQKAFGNLGAAIEEQKNAKAVAELRRQGLGEMKGKIEAGGFPGNVFIPQFERYARDQKSNQPILPNRLRSRILEAAGLKDEGQSITQGKGGRLDIRARVGEEEKKEAAKQVGQIDSTIKEMEAQQKNAAENLNKLNDVFNVEARTEVDFMQREAKARFNRYALGKIQIEKQERDERRADFVAGFGNVITRPQLTERQFQKRKRDLMAQEQQELDSTDKRMQVFRDSQRNHGRVLTKEQIKGFEDEKDQIRENTKVKMKQLEKEREGPETLLDVADRARQAMNTKRRLELAQEFANQGPPAHITSIEGLWRDVALGQGGGKGLDIAQQTADNTKGILQAQMDLITAVKDLKPGLGP